MKPHKIIPVPGADGARKFILISRKFKGFHIGVRLPGTGQNKEMK